MFSSLAMQKVSQGLGILYKQATPPPCTLQQSNWLSLYPSQMTSAKYTFFKHLHLWALFLQQNSQDVPLPYGLFKPSQRCR